MKDIIFLHDAIEANIWISARGLLCQNVVLEVDGTLDNTEVLLDKESVKELIKFLTEWVEEIPCSL